MLENKYGKSLDKGIHCFHWTHSDYSFEDLSNSNIFIRKYHEPKNDKSSKIVIQGNFQLAIAYVTDELPKIYKNVYELKRTALPNSEVIYNSCDQFDYNSVQLGEFEEHVKKHQIVPAQESLLNVEPIPAPLLCSKCDMEIINVTELKKHMKKPHHKCDKCNFVSTKIIV